MALWTTIGDFIRGSGWPEAVAEAGIAWTVTAATSYLRENGPMRIGYAHQVTVVVLDSLLKRAYEDSGSEMTFDDWFSVACKEKPTVQFQLLSQWYKQLIFTFIRSHRERKSKLMVATLKNLCFCSLHLVSRIMQCGFLYSSETLKVFHLASKKSLKQVIGQ